MPKASLLPTIICNGETVNVPSVFTPSASGNVSGLTISPHADLVYFHTEHGQNFPVNYVPRTPFSV